MYQSVMAKRQGAGTSGTGFAFVLVEIKEIHPDTNICVARDVDNNASYYQLGLNKRGETAWPQVGDRWIIDRSLGHWALQAKVTETEAPEFTGNFSTMDPDLLRLMTILKGLGLVQDATTAGTVPAVTGSRNRISPAVQSILGILDARGILDDQTTAETLPVDVWQTPTLASPWVVYNDPVSGAYQNPRYMIGRDGFVTMEGLAKTTADVTGTSNVFTLPSDFHPPKTIVFTSLQNGPAARQFEVMGSGVVRFNGLPTATVTYASIACRFATF